MRHNGRMVAFAVTGYYESLPEPKRATLLETRRRILDLVPDAQERMSYGLPAFAVGGRVVAGLGAFTAHLAYLPHSGTVLAALGPLIADYPHTKSSLHFAVDRPLEVSLLRALLDERLRAAGLPPTAN